MTASSLVEGAQCSRGGNGYFLSCDQLSESGLELWGTSLDPVNGFRVKP